MPGISISIEARDNASATLDNVRSKLQLFDQFGRQASDLSEKFDRVERSIGGFDLSVSKAARGVRSLVAPIASELTPALGQFGSQMAGVITTAALFGTGLTAVGIAAAAAAGIVGGQLLTAWRHGREELSHFNRALGSGDLARVSSEYDRLTKSVVDLSEKVREARKGGVLDLFLLFRGGLAFDPRTGGLADLNRDLDKTAKARAEREALRDVEIPGLTNAEQNALLAARARETFSLQQSQRGLFDFTLPGPYASRAEALRRADDLEAAGHPAAAATARAAAQAQFGFTRDLAGARLFARPEPSAVSDYEGLFFGEGGQGQVRELLQGLDARDRQREMDLLRNRGEVLGEHAVSDYGELVFGDRASSEARQAIEDLTTRQLERQLSITRDIATLNEARTDLSAAQHDALTLQAIEEERILKIKMAQNDEAKELAADVEAALKRRQVLEATDPTAGLLRGLSDIERDWGAAGLRMQEVAHQTAGGMARAFDDSLFNVLTGNFKDMPNVAKQFGADMVRALTGELSKFLVAPIVGQFRSTLESLFPGGGGTAAIPFGGGSGGGPYLTAAGRPLSESEIRVAYEASGDAGVRALRSGDAAVIGGEFVQAGAGLEQVSGGAGIGITPATSRFSFRQGAGIAGSAALLGLTAFGARGAQTNFDIGASAALGGLTGLQLGSQIGGLFGDSGGAVGGGVGALAGAAIAGTIAFLAKQEADRERAKARQAAELERAAGAGTDLVRSASQSQSLADFFRRVTAFGSGATGGTANPAVRVGVATPQGEQFIGFPGFGLPTATLQDVLAAPESLRASIQAGVSPESLAGPNAAASQALQAIARDLVDQFREAEQGVGLTQQDMLGGLTRRTTFPASRADMLNAALAVEIDQLAYEALSDDDKALLQLEVLNRVAIDTDFVGTISDGATGQIVSITRIARSTIPLPGATTPAGLTPEAVAALQSTFRLNIPQFTEPPPVGAPIFGPVMISLGGEFAGAAGGLYESGETQPTGRFAPPTAEQVAAYEARKTAFYAPYVEQLAADAKAQLAALTVDQVQAGLTAGLFTPATLAALVQAGLVPALRNILPPEMLAVLDAGGDGAAGSVSIPNSVALADAISSALASLATVPGSPTSTPIGLAGQLASWGLQNFVALSPMSSNLLGTAVNTALGLAGPIASLANLGLGALAAFFTAVFGLPSTLGLGFPANAEFQDITQQITTPAPDFSDVDASTDPAGVTATVSADPSAAGPTSDSGSGDTSGTPGSGF